MKKSMKNILAGMCLACVGAGALAGCSLSDDQVNDINTKIDTSIEKFDTYTENQNKNMQDMIDALVQQNDMLKTELQNKEMTRKEALNKIYLARQYFYFQNFDQLKYCVEFNTYNGMFDQLLEDGHQVGSFFYRNDESCKILYQDYTSYNEIEYKKSDFLNNVHYDYDCEIESNELNEDFDVVSYTPDRFIIGDLFDFYAILDIDFITEDNIYDIKITDDGCIITLCFVSAREYKFSDSEYFNYFNKEFVEITVSNNLFTNINFVMVGGKKIQSGPELNYEKDEKGNFVNPDEIFIKEIDNCEEIYSCDGYINYQYENIDFTEIDAKIGEIESRFLLND